MSSIPCFPYVRTKKYSSLASHEQSFHNSLFFKCFPAPPAILCIHCGLINHSDIRLKHIWKKKYLSYFSRPSWLLGSISLHPNWLGRQQREKEIYCKISFWEPRDRTCRKQDAGSDLGPVRSPVRNWG